MSAVLKL